MIVAEMGSLLREPTGVVLVGGAETDFEAVRSVLEPGAKSTVAVGSLDAMSNALTDRADIGCVLAVEGVEAAPEAICGAVSQHDPDLPVIAYGPESSALHAIGRQAGCQFVSQSDDGAQLRAALENTVASYERRREERAKRSALDTLLSEVNLDIYALDEHARYVYKTDVDGHSRPMHFIGKTGPEARPDEIRQKAEEDLALDREVIETGEPSYGVERNYTALDPHYWVRTTRLPWRDRDGERRGLVGITENVSQEKLYEQRVRKQQSRIDDLLRYVTHKLRTPLQVAYGSLYPESEVDERTLDAAADAVEQMRSFIDRVERQAENTSGQTPTSALMRAFSAEMLATDMLPTINAAWSSVDRGETTLDVDLPRDTTISVRPTPLRQFLEQLLELIAGRSSDQGRVQIGKATSRGFYVADDGPTVTERERAIVSGDDQRETQDWTGRDERLATLVETADNEDWELRVTESRAGGVRFEVGQVPMVTDHSRRFVPDERLSLSDWGDVGDVALSGTATADRAGEKWTVRAGGQNFWAYIHEFHWVGTTATAPVRIQARIADLDGVDEWSMAGVAVRGSERQFAPLQYIGTTYAHGPEITWRFPAEFTHSYQFGEPPGTFEYFRVDYADGVATSAVSVDGEEWTPLDQCVVDLGEAVVPGLLVCGHHTGQRAEAAFEDVRAWTLTEK